MKGIPRFTKRYFEKFRTSSLILKPFTLRQKGIGIKTLEEIVKVINDPNVEVVLRGSTLFEILGKGDIDIGIYATPKKWQMALNKLLISYGEARVIEKTFAAFNFERNGFPIEISLMKGHQIKVDKALTTYLLNNPKSLAEYENLKKQYCFSKREYLIQRDKFFRSIINSL